MAVLAGAVVAASDLNFHDGLKVYEEADESGQDDHPGYRKALQIWRELASLGDEDAEYHLSFLYWRGLGGVEHSPEVAFRLIRSAAEKGHPDAQFSLGNQYEHGFDIERSYELALHWYEHAARSGSWIAAERLASAYERGELGLTVNLEQASEWRSIRRSGSTESEEHCR